MSEIKRLNYFNSQFLVEKDFTDEQAYHIQKRRLHNQWLHSWGVAGDGLQVSGKKGTKSIIVSKGIAIDKNGNEIVLLEPLTVDLSNNQANTTVWVTANVKEVKLPSDRYKEGGVDDYTRLTEQTNIEPGKAAPATDGSVILLATVTLDASGNIDNIANDVRRFAGISPGTRVDIQTAPRTTLTIAGVPADVVHHPTNLALYVTSSNSADGRGVEFRHSNGGQGIGFGWNTIYATGANPNQPLNLKSRGTGELSLTGNSLKLNGTTTVTGVLIVSSTLSVNAIYAHGTAENIPLGLKPKGTGGVDLAGNTTVTGSLTVTGQATLERGLTVAGVAEVKDNLHVGGQVIVAQGFLVNAEAYIAKDLTISGKLNVDTISVHANASHRVDIVQESWNLLGKDGAPALQADWADYPDPNFDTPAYFKDSLGIVHLRGLVLNPKQENDSVISSVIFTLPDGYRPEKASVNVVISGHPTQTPPPGMPIRIYGRVDVRANGQVILVYGRPQEYVSLAGISFRAK